MSAKSTLGRAAVVSSVLLIAWLALAIAAPRSEEEIREAVKALISQRHPKDTADVWRALGDGAPAVIIRMHEASTDAIERTQLIGGLAAFGDDPEVGAYLRKLAEGPGDGVIKQKAIAAIGASQGAASVDYLSKFLSDPDAQVRLVAAQAIQRHGEARGRDVIEAYVKTEKATWIAARLKGDAPGTPRKLVPVATSEDRPSPDFTGVWKGVWLIPDPVAGLASRPAEFRVETADLKLKLALVLDPGRPSARYIELKGWTARGPRAQGTMPESLSPKPASGPLAVYVAELEREPAGWRLLIRSQTAPQVLAVRKTKSP